MSEQIIMPGVDDIDPLAVKKDNLNRVGIRMGKTINIGNYESIRMDCWIEKTHESGETPEQEQKNRENAYNECKAFCSEKVKKFVEILERRTK